MNPTAKISSSHLSRQSTVAQVRFNTESTQRQYGLVGTAAEFGWLAEQIVVVDADLGVSGRFGAERDGYRQIVARMCMGEVGAVFGLEISRFGRSNADLTRLTWSDYLAVEALFLDTITPEQIGMAVSAAEEVAERHTRSHRAAELAVQQARYEADRAERAFSNVEPETVWWQGLWSRGGRPGWPR